MTLSGSRRPPRHQQEAQQQLDEMKAQYAAGNAASGLKFTSESAKKAFLADGREEAAAAGGRDRRLALRGLCESKGRPGHSPRIANTPA